MFASKSGPRPEVFADWRVRPLCVYFALVCACRSFRSCGMPPRPEAPLRLCFASRHAGCVQKLAHPDGMPGSSSYALECW